MTTAEPPVDTGTNQLSGAVMTEETNSNTATVTTNTASKQQPPATVPILPTASASTTSSSHFTSSDRDEVRYTLSLYENLSQLPRKDYVKKLATIASILESADDPCMHIWQIEELLNEYLKTARYNQVPGAAQPEEDADYEVPHDSLHPPKYHSLIGANAEFTTHFLENSLPTIVRNLLMRSFTIISMVRPMSNQTDSSEAIVARVNQFFQCCLRVIVKHLKEPVVPKQMILPAPPAAVPAGTSHSVSSTSASAPPAPAAPIAVTVQVKPLFPDSICTNLITTLQRIFDRERQFYYYYDRKGKGVDDDFELSSDDDDDDDDNTALLRLDDAVIQRVHKMTPEQYRESLKEQKQLRQAEKERLRAERIEAKIANQKKIEELRPEIQFSLGTPGMGSHGWFQRNLQYFGMIGGFEVIQVRLGVGINYGRIDSRILVAARKGLNPAKGSRTNFYRIELNRRLAWARQCEKRGIKYSPYPPTPPPGSFPSIAPYLTKESFLDTCTVGHADHDADDDELDATQSQVHDNGPPETTLTSIGLHRFRLFLDVINKTWNLMHQDYFIEYGTKLKDIIVVRLLNIRSDESRLCDKEYLTDLLQNYLWVLIYNLCCIFTDQKKDVAWPVLDPISDKRWKLDKRKMKLVREAREAKEAQLESEEAAKAAAEAGEAANESGGEISAAVSPSSSSVSDEQLEFPPPPVLYEMNLNADELMESITIYLSYKLFVSPLLEKRINGLSDINRMVDLTIVRHRIDNPPGGIAPVPAPNAPRIPVTAWLNMEVLSEYILQIRFIDETFGAWNENPEEKQEGDASKSTHPHLIAKCDEIVRYLARLDKLDATHLRQIWAASVGKHETIVDAVYTLLGSSIRCFHLKHIQQILDEFLPSIPFSLWNEHTLGLLVAMLEGGSDEEEEVIIIHRGINILWQLANLPQPARSVLINAKVERVFQQAPFVAGTNVSFAIRSACARQMQLLFGKPHIEPARRGYIMSMVNLIAEKRINGIQYWILPCALACYTNQRPQPEEMQRWKFLGGLLDKQKLYSTFFNELVAFTQQTNVRYEQMRDALSTSGKRKHRSLPEPSLLVLSNNDPTAADANDPRLGVCLTDLVGMTLPSGMDQSVELLTLLQSLPSTATGATSTSASTAAGSTSTANTSAAVSLPKSSLFSHELELFLRFEFLRFIVANSFTPIAARHVDMLWNGCVLQSISSYSRSQFFYWLRTFHVPKPATQPVWIAEQMAAAAQAQAAAVGTSKFVPTFMDLSRTASTLTPEAVTHLFQTKLCSWTTPQQIRDQMDEAAFICWRHYFLVLNEAAKQVRLYQPLGMTGTASTGAAGGVPSVPVVQATSNTPLSQVLQPIKFTMLPSSTPLIGIEYLWSICLHASSPVVVQLAVDMLIQAHGSSADGVEDAEWLCGLREAYVARCMEFMSTTTSAAPTSTPSVDASVHSQKVLRCLSLLHSFMQACAGGHEIDETSNDTEHAPSGAATFTVEVSESEEIHRLLVSDGQTVRTLKEQLSSILSLAASKMALVTVDGTELLNYETLHAPIGLLTIKPPTNRSNIQHRENDRAMEDDEADADEDMTPLNLARAFTPATNLSGGAGVGASAVAGTFPATSQAAVLLSLRNPTQLLSTKYFDVLFSLLSPAVSSSSSSTAEGATNAEISQRVWKLITSLPTNQKLLDEMKSLSIASSSLAGWSALLDARSPFKLFYSLRIISKLTATHLPPRATPAPAASSTSTQQPAATQPQQHALSKQYMNACEWRNKFLKLGGAEYMYQVLTTLLEQRAAAHARPTTAAAATAGTSVEWCDTRNSCLALLLKLFNFFLILSQAHENIGVCYLLQEVLSDSLVPTDSLQLQYLSRNLIANTHTASLLQVVSFTTLMKEGMKLLSDCAKSTAKAWKVTNGVVTHARSGSTSSPMKPQRNSVATSTEIGVLDDVLIRQSMILISACLLQSASTNATPSVDPVTPLSVLTSSASSTLYSTLLFLCPPSITHEASESWLRLAQEYKAHVKSSPPLTIHRFLVQDVLLKCLSTLQSVRYADVAQDYFQLLDHLIRDLLDHEVAAAGDNTSQKIMPNFDWTAFFMQIVAYMRGRPIYETKHAGAACSLTTRSNPASKHREIACDEVLIGLMNLTSTMLNRLKHLKDLISERPRAHSLELDELMSDLSVTTTSSSSTTPAEPTHNTSAGLVHEIYNYLFDLPTLQTSHLTIQAPKVKRRVTRLAAFNLLLTMVENHPHNFYTLSSLLYHQNVTHNSMHNSSEWEYSPEDQTKSNTGYVGLQNLHSTCYLNSMMQQMYMIPSFRRRLLSVNIPNSINSIASTSASATGRTSPVESKSNGQAPSSAPFDPTDHLLYQTQFMFGFLEASRKKAYNPANFCKSFKDYEGHGIDVRVQQDVDEFFNAFCDRLEAALKSNQEQLAASNGRPSTAADESSSHVDLVKSTFGGELEHQLLCDKSCGHKSYRSEAFCALPLNVKNKSNIHASLENFIQGEMLEGDNAYMCHSCQPARKVRTFKRVCVKTLPQILVLNLKRFEFNYESMLKCKLNDYVSFPIELGGLDMEPYTKEGLARKEAAKEAAAAAAAVGLSTPAVAVASPNEEKKDSLGDESVPTSAPSLQHAASLGGAPAPNTAQTTYSLIGVLLHSGGSESGHYTSLVRDRSSPNGSRWLEFNDSVVREFDESQIPSECFGGAQVVSIWDTKLRRKVMKEVEKTRSAYLLIYERDSPNNTNASVMSRHSSETPIMSPKRLGMKVPHSAHAFAPSSDADSSERQSPTKFTSSHAPSRSKTPIIDLKRSPHQSPTTSPPPSLVRGSSGPGMRLAKKLDYDAMDDLPPPAYSPSFSRHPSETFSSVPISSSLHESKVPESEVVTSMPPQIYESIWNENLVFLKNSQLFQLDYFKFLCAFLALAPPHEKDDGRGEVDPTRPRARRLAYGLPNELGCEEEIRHIQLASLFLTDVLAHAKYITNPVAYERDRDRSVDEELRSCATRTTFEHRTRMHMLDSHGPPQISLPIYKNMLIQFCVHHIPATCWFIHEHLLGARYRMRYFLFECSSAFMRDFLSETFGIMMGVLVPIERPLYEKVHAHEVKASTNSGAPQSNVGATTHTVYTPAAFSLQLIDSLMGLFKDLAFNWRSLSPYFSLLLAFAALGYNERMHLIGHHTLIVSIIDLLLGNYSPYAKHERHKRPVLGDAETPPNLYNAYTLLSLLVRSCLMSTSAENPHRILPPTLLTVLDGLIPLPHREEFEAGVDAILDGSALASLSVSPSAVEAAAAESDDLPQHADSDATKSGSSSRARTAPSTPIASRQSSQQQQSRVPSSLLLYLPPRTQISITYVLNHTHTLLSDEVEFVFEESFLKKLMKEGANILANTEIITHLCFDEDQADRWVTKLYLQFMDESNYDRLEPLFAILPSILSIQDSMQSQRIDRYLNGSNGAISKAAYHRSQYPLFTYAVLKFIILQLGKMGGPVTEYLVNNRDALYWSVAWIQQHHERTMMKPHSLNLSALSSSMMDSTSSSNTPELRRQQTQAQFETLTAIQDWFGAEYLQQRAEIERAAHERLVRANAERMAQIQAARAAAIASTAGGNATAGGSDPNRYLMGEGAGDDDIDAMIAQRNYNDRHLDDRFMRGDDTDEDRDTDPGSRVGYADSDREFHLDSENEADPDANYEDTTREADRERFMEEDRTIESLLLQPNGKELAIRASQKFKFQHPKIQKLIKELTSKVNAELAPTEQQQSNTNPPPAAIPAKVIGGGAAKVATLIDSSTLPPPDQSGYMSLGGGGGGDASHGSGEHGSLLGSPDPDEEWHHRSEFNDPHVDEPDDDEHRYDAYTNSFDEYADDDDPVEAVRKFEEEQAKQQQQQQQQKTDDKVTENEAADTK